MVYLSPMGEKMSISILYIPFKADPTPLLSTDPETCRDLLLSDKCEMSVSVTGAFNEI